MTTALPLGWPKAGTGIQAKKGVAWLPALVMGAAIRKGDRLLEIGGYIFGIGLND